MANMKAIIQGHNRKIIDNDNTILPDDSCNCRIKEDCPLDGDRCRQENIIYKATVSTSADEKDYIGSSGNSFKSRYAGHKTSFKHEKYQNSTRLSRHVWSLKNKGIPFSIKWSIINKIGKRSGGGQQRMCLTCNLERLAIASADRKRTLNKRSELTGNCPHEQGSYFQKMF